MDSEWQVWTVDNIGEVEDLIGAGFKSREEAEFWVKDVGFTDMLLITDTGD